MKPSTLAQQVAWALAIWNSWTPEKRDSVRLQGQTSYSNPPRAGKGK